MLFVLFILKYNDEWQDLQMFFFIIWIRVLALPIFFIKQLFQDVGLQRLSNFDEVMVI